MRSFKNAIGYIRVSTEQQAMDDKYGIDVQKQAILLYANNNGYNIVEWKIDEMSGASDNRPEFNDILYGSVYNPPFEAVIVFKNDRVARDIKLYFYYLYTLEKKNLDNRFAKIACEISFTVLDVTASEKTGRDNL